MNPGKRITVLLLATTLMSPGVSAAVSEEEFRALGEQLVAINARLDELENSNESLRQLNERLRQSSSRSKQAAAGAGEPGTRATEQISDRASDPSWPQRIRIKGDFRHRFETIDEDNKDSRNRNRIRARAAIIADVNDDLEVGLGLASGGDDPVSSNQTLGGGGSSKNINLDLAYFKWSGWENTKLVGGKFKNILYKPGQQDMIWDGDWNPEGFGLSWANGDFFANAIGTWLESDSNKKAEFSYALQAGLNKRIADRVSLTAGIGYYNMGTKGKGSFFGDDDDFFGNSFDPLSNVYLHNYEELELFAEIGFELADRPASVFVDYVQNQDASDFDSGYSIGFRYGNAASKGDWQFAYFYRDLEADAALGLLVESDFAGGGTGARGHVLSGSYAIATGWNTKLSYFLNEKEVDTANEHDADRIQVDLTFKY